jgi:hypothetical protein
MLSLRSVDSDAAQMIVVSRRRRRFAAFSAAVSLRFGLPMLSSASPQLGTPVFRHGAYRPADIIGQLRQQFRLPAGQWGRAIRRPSDQGLSRTLAEFDTSYALCEPGRHKKYSPMVSI